MKFLYIFFILIPLTSLQSQDCNLFKESNCIEDLDKYYYYEEKVLKSDCSNFFLDNKKKTELRIGLTQSIVSFIESKSTQVLNFSSNKKRFFENETFNSLSESKSSAILFNPKFKLCKKTINNKKVNIIAAYVEKESFNILAVNFFKSEINRLNKNLKSLDEYYLENPLYGFDLEKKKLESRVKVIASYYGLIVSLESNEELINSFFEIENSINIFLKKINSLENNLSIIDTYMQGNNFLKSYELIEKLKKKYPNNRKLNIKIDFYNKFVKLEKIKQIKLAKESSTASNKLSFGFGVNSSLQSKDFDKSLSNSTQLDKIYPHFEVKLELNDRDGKFGIGPYFKFNYSKALIKIKDSEFNSKFPFSNNFSEIGGYFKVFSKNLSSSITVSAGKLLENFITEEGEKLNYWTFSPGINIFIKKPNRDSYRSSISIKYNILASKDQYSFNSWSIVFYRDIKIGKKLPLKEKQRIGNEFKTF